MNPSLKAFPLIVLFLMLFASGPVRAQTYTGHHNASVFSGSQSNPNNLSLTTSGTSGTPTVIAFVGAIADNKSVTMSTPTDSAGNTYVQCGTTQDNTTAHIEEALWVAVNTAERDPAE